MSVKRTPLKLGPSHLGSPMQMFRSEFFYSPLAASNSSAIVNSSFDPLSVSYDFNQSFPRNATMKRSRRKRHHRPLADTKNPTFFIGSSNGTDSIVDSLVTDENSFNFSTSSSFVNVGCSVDVANSSVAPLPGSRRSLQASTMATGSSMSLASCSQLPSVAMNPNKAVLSLDKDGVVAVVNDVACHLLGYGCEQLVGKSLDEIVSGVDLGTAVDQEDFEISKGAKSGARVIVSGKVVDAKRGDGELVPVSLWMRQIDGNKRKIALLEEVAVTTGEMTVSNDSLAISSADNGAAVIFQTEVNELIGADVCGVIPCLGSSLLEQGDLVDVHTLGRLKSGASFPVSLKLRRLADQSDSESTKIQVSVYHNLSGLVVLNSAGGIESANSHFVNLLFGCGSDDLKGKDVTALIPAFYSLDNSSLKYTTCSKLDDDDEDDLGCVSFKEEKEESGDSVASRDKCESGDFSDGEEAENNVASHLTRADTLHVTSTPFEPGKSANCQRRRRITAREFPDGAFYGFGRHRNGGELAIFYHVKRVQISEDGGAIYCLWISRDSEAPFYQAAQQTSTTTTAEGRSILGDLASLNLKSVGEGEDEEDVDDVSSGGIDMSLGKAIRTAASKEKAEDEAETESSSELAAITAGAYSHVYGTLQEIGRGAFGSVMTGFRREDGKMVVTKFIDKSKIPEEDWLADPAGTGARSPMEAALLSTLSHDNIVTVLDVFDNDSCVQLVMEKHGAGMDLFEFIDRGPNTDEPINSYIFRQIVAAVDYLHDNGILHRDLKDENVIIDERFRVKLIDFGSATFRRPPGEPPFTLFHGTVEYCSPEVLEGNPYEGPELEMWSLGVLLYVLIYHQNPFFSIEETILCLLAHPRPVSSPCLDLLRGLLKKDPKKRFPLDRVRDHEWTTMAVDPATYNFADVVDCTVEELNPPTHHFFPGEEEEEDKENSNYNSVIEGL